MLSLPYYTHTPTNLEEHVEGLAILCQVTKGLLPGQALVQDAPQAVHVSSLVHTAAGR